MRDTAASRRSVEECMGPSGRPSWTGVSESEKTSSSESDQSSSWGIRESVSGGNQQTGGIGGRGGGGAKKVRKA